MMRNNMSFNRQYIKKIFETDDGYADWFGYYNYDPLNEDCTLMLCNRANFDGRAIEESDYIELGYYEINSGHWNQIGKTNAFNWQQGSMLQWIPGAPNKVIYNTIVDSRYVSCIYDIESKENRYLQFPIYALFPDGKHALALNYERSYWCRAYHYQPIKNPKYNVPVAEDDGVFVVDLETGEYKRIVDIADVINIEYSEEFKTSSHWIEHVMINREGTKVVFLHRYSSGNVLEYRTRVIVCNIDGTNIRVVSGWKNEQWSHVGWKSENEFVVYTTTPSSNKAIKQKMAKNNKGLYDFTKLVYQRVLRPVLGNRMRRKFETTGSYRLYSIQDDAVVEVEIYKNIGNIDGHPSYTNSGKYLFTDTYPDQSGYQHLIVYNPKNQRSIELGKFFAPFMGNPASCDLHPKLNRSNDFIMVDTAYSGLHHLILFEINWNRIVKELG